MLDATVEELEQILIETNRVKQSLNRICELSWDCLCPFGKNGTGKFTLERIIGNTKTEASTSATSNTVKDSSLEDVLSNVSDLIAYGKQIRTSTHLENVKGNTKGHKAQSTACDSHSKRSVNANSELLAKSDSKCHKKVIPMLKNSTKTQAAQNDSIKLSTKDYSTKEDYVGERNDQKAVTQKAFSRRLQTSNKYKHSCSENLADSAKSFKIPPDLVSMHKLYNQYENIKMEKHQNMNQFIEKFYNHVKSRLESDLKEHVKQEERYVKYLDVADSVYKSQEDNNLLGGLHNCVIQYKTEEQLLAFEDRYHRLMELQFQKRLMDVVNNTIST